MLSLRWAVWIAAIASAFSASAARADHQPVIALPGKPGVPVIIDGRDATGALVIGDWGLYRPGAVAPVIVPLGPFPPAPHWRYCHCRRRVRVHVRRRPRPVVAVPVRHYFPGGTLARPVVKLPAETALPRPAESYSREWSTRSAPSPADLASPPAVLVEPNVSLGGSPSRPPPETGRPRLRRER